MTQLSWKWRVISWCLDHNEAFANIIVDILAIGIVAIAWNLGLLK